jgi:hypothetical protein
VRVTSVLAWLGAFVLGWRLRDYTRAVRFSLPLALAAALIEVLANRHRDGVAVWGPVTVLLVLGVASACTILGAHVAERRAGAGTGEAGTAGAGTAGAGDARDAGARDG